MITDTTAPALPEALDAALRRMRLPRRFRAHIELAIGEAVTPEQASAAALESQVRALRGDWA